MFGIFKKVNIETLSPGDHFDMDGFSYVVKQKFPDSQVVEVLYSTGAKSYLMEVVYGTKVST